MMTNIHVLPQLLPVEDVTSVEHDEVVEQVTEARLYPVAAPEAEPPRLPQSTQDAEPVGAALEDIRSELLRHGERLAGLLADPAATFVRDALRVLENQICRIAVIGQVKSGQSAFVGALVEQPDLLPQDVSPWSTAVTRMHFGWAGAPAGLAAEFQLFEGVDWHRLAAGTGKVRELTTQLVPGFEPDLLRRHLEAMRQRSEQRFGENFQAVLGARHTHETVSHEVLDRYLSPGSSAATVNDGPGQFADITRSADLYFSSGPFRFPVTVIATPGINDPFLVRDEITRHTLEEADLYVVVLSARQPLATADVSLLRILRGLHKDRLAVFIDHVDELRDPANEARNIVAHVRQALEREFPSVEIPVVAGSARWATDALRGDALDIQHMLTPALLAYAKHKGALRPIEVKGNGASGAADDVSTGQLCRALSVCSGYPELKRALTGLLERSHSAHLVRQIAAYFAELSVINEGSVREDMVNHAVASEGVAEQNAAAERELQHVQNELFRIQAVASELERKLAGLQNLMGEVIAEQRSYLYTGLASLLETYAHREGDGLILAFEDGRARRNWKCDCASLRHVVETELQRAERAAESRIASSEFNVFPALHETMLRMTPDVSLPPAPAFSCETVQPIGALTAAIPANTSIDLGASGPLIGWARSRLPVEHAGELERLLIQDLMPAIDEVIRVATGELHRRVSVMSERSTAIAVAVIERLRQQSEGYITRAKELLDARDNRPAEEVAQAEHLAGLRDRLAVSEALTRRLADLNTRCGHVIG